MTLSKREQVLLYVLTLVLVLVGSWTYLITPQLAANQAAQLAYEQAQAQQQQQEMLMPTLIGVEDRLTEEINRKAAQSFFFTDLRDTEIDWNMQRIAANSGVKLTSVVLSPVMTGPVAAPINDDGTAAGLDITEIDSTEEAADAETTEEDSDTEETTDEETDTAPQTASAASMMQPQYNCAMTMMGDLPAIMQALDAFPSLGRSVTVNSFTIEYDDEQQIYTADANVTFYITGGQTYGFYVQEDIQEDAQPEDVQDVE